MDGSLWHFGIALSITTLLNAGISRGYLPDVRKKAIITFTLTIFFKKGHLCQSDLYDIRPISVLAAVTNAWLTIAPLL